jgi:hypothetical protein
VIPLGLTLLALLLELLLHLGQLVGGLDGVEDGPLVELLGLLLGERVALVVLAPIDRLLGGGFGPSLRPRRGLTGTLERSD